MHLFFLRLTYEAMLMKKGQTTFLEFLELKSRTSSKELEVISKVLKRFGMDVKLFDENNDDVYLYVSSKKDTTFGGIRVYKIGESFAFRIQQQEDTHPYGKPYVFDIPQMYEDILIDCEMDEKKAANELAKEIAETIRKFFVNSLKAEEETGAKKIEKDKDPLGSVMVRSTGTDYASQMQS